MAGIETTFVITCPQPLAVHGVWINGTEVFDNEDYVQRGRGAGQVLRGFAA